VNVSSLTQPVGSETGQDQPLFDSITQDVAPEPSATPLLLLDRTRRIPPWPRGHPDSLSDFWRAIHRIEGAADPPA
jgi:hypothetical protein